jgi:uncharacterized membrane protein
MFCGVCGTEIAEEDVLCPECGSITKHGKSLQEKLNKADPPASASQKFKEGAVQFAHSLSAEGDMGVMDKPARLSSKAGAMISYFGIIGILVTLLIGDKKDRFTAYHVNQGMCLVITNIVVPVVLMVPLGILGILALFLPFLLVPVGVIILAVFSLFSIIMFILNVLGFIRAAKGKARPLPFVGRFKVWNWEPVDPEQGGFGDDIEAMKGLLKKDKRKEILDGEFK